MKSLIGSFLRKPIAAKLFLNFLLRVHNEIYKLISILSITAENGIHPKHAILKYHEWFLSKVDGNSVVLDIGCNTGNLLNKLADKIKRGYGIDILPKLVQIAVKNNRNPNIEFIHADATLYDYSRFPDLNVLTLSNVLEHIEHRVDFLKIIIHSLNGRHCRVLIRVPLITRDWLACYKRQRGVEYRLDMTHFTEYTEDQIVEELKLAGLRINDSVIKFGEIYLDCEAN